MASDTYWYTARTLEGTVVRGSMQAVDEEHVVSLLRSRMLFITAVAKDGNVGGRLRRALRVGGVSHGALLAFFRCFVTLVRAGVSIQRSLTVTIERASDPALVEALRSILADVEHGSPLSDAMSRRPSEFPPLYVAMIRAGEAGGILDDVLERLALLLERETALRKKLQTALAYPLIVLFSAGLLVIFLIAKIVPMFAQMFASFNVDLPAPTQWLLRLSELLSAPLPWLLMSLSAALGATFVYRFARTAVGSLVLDGLRFHIPLIGPLLHKSIGGRVARMLATLLRSGIELVAAIDAIIPICGSPRYARAFERVNVALRAGEPFSRPLRDSRLFDPMFLALVSAGEETGALDEMLLKVAEYFESDVETSIATLGTVIEPALVIFLGGVVGFIVLSIFLPLYSLIGSVSK